MAAEIWDLYDGCGEKTGRTMVRGEAIPTGFYHIGVHIWRAADSAALHERAVETGNMGRNGRFRRERGRTLGGRAP